MRWAYLILPSRSRRRSEGAVVPRYRHKPRARSLGCGNWRLSPNALVSIPVGPAGPAHRFLRASPQALADSVPDHRDVRQPARPLRRPHVREPLRQGVRIRDQPRADRRGHGVHRGAVRDRGPSPLEGGARLDLPRARPRFLRDPRVGPARSLLPESRPVFCLPLPLRRAPGGRLGLGPLVRRGACRLDPSGVLEIRPAWHAGFDPGLNHADPRGASDRGGVRSSSSTVLSSGSSLRSRATTTTVAIAMAPRPITRFSERTEGPATIGPAVANEIE